MPPVDPPFTFDRITMRYVIRDRASISHEVVRTYDMRAQRRCRFFEHRYAWSGAGSESEPVVVPMPEQDPASVKYRLHGPVLHDATDAKRLFLIDLGRDVAPGEPVVVSFSQELLDQAHTFKSFITKNVRHDIGALRFELVLPEGLASSVTTWVTDMVSGEPIGPPESVPLADNGSYVKDFDEPLLHHRYGLRWS